MGNNKKNLYGIKPKNVGLFKISRTIDKFDKIRLELLNSKLRERNINKSDITYLLDIYDIHTLISRIESKI